MSICHVWLGSHFAPEISRREIKTMEDIPNFEKEDIVYPCDMDGGEGTDICLTPESAEIWFEDEAGNTIGSIRLDPSSNNGVNYVDGGNAFDESDSSKSFFYFLFVWDKQSWAGPDLEVEDAINPENWSVRYKRFTDMDGDIHVIMYPDSITFKGEEMDFEAWDGDGSDGEDYWVLMDGKRKAVLPPDKAEELE